MLLIIYFIIGLSFNYKFISELREYLLKKKKILYNTLLNIYFVWFEILCVLLYVYFYVLIEKFCLGLKLSKGDKADYLFIFICNLIPNNYKVK